MTFLEGAAAHPGRVLVALCAAQALFWTLAPALTHSAPPLDVVEMLVWGREGVVATYKHPNLPGLLLMALLPGRFDGRRLARLGAMAAGLLVLVPAAYAASVLFGAAISHKPVRVAWPQGAIAGRLLGG